MTITTALGFILPSVIYIRFFFLEEEGEGMAIYYVSPVFTLFSRSFWFGHNSRIWLENLRNCEGALDTFMLSCFEM